MASLSKEQIEFIRADLTKRPVSRSFLFNEWVDHVCCDVESLINKGMDFDDAYRYVMKDKPETEVRDAHERVQQFLNHKYVGIKWILYIALLIYAVSWIINFKGAANWVGMISFVILTIVYVRISIDFFRERRVRNSHILFTVFAGLTALGMLSGIILLFLNWNFGIDTRGHGVDLTVFGWFFFSLLCLIYYIQEWKSSFDKKEVRRLKLFARISGVSLALATVSIATFPLYALVEERIFFLIGLILGFDTTVLIAMLITRTMKNTLAVALIIGSIMTVFIHSPFRSRLPGGQPKLYGYTIQYSPVNDPDQETVYLYMYYKRFPGNPFTLPLRVQADRNYRISMPSYAFKGYLYYRLEKDSVDAVEYFRQYRTLDSIFIDVPKVKTYEIHW